MVLVLNFPRRDHSAPPCSFCATVLSTLFFFSLRISRITCKLLSSIESGVAEYDSRTDGSERLSAAPVYRADRRNAARAKKTLQNWRRKVRVRAGKAGTRSQQVPDGIGVDCKPKFRTVTWRVFTFVVGPQEEPQQEPRQIVDTSKYPGAVLRAIRADGKHR